ncbi:hypothetical protein P175DRAFT_0501071 [Aspergillus ochraceoroseus IBT 24754]|uniref:Uncharacterized protein n=1 Tax=Aspergillus ochraceoroseus IBT 24754 TaxID=1392256 RepID=A0A2T5M115_9EURO|nr:uncharacterized protein P175DRAFT_0501071 [Aspergillus ochraceoroseus IBT 24754]PTU22216.1 hypothetical protein P175DRAFT_0501071 [Aspergillus ochraceoroseus IBT 24754]
MGHYIRYPVDMLLLPVSILFGYFHGGIKMYAVLTLSVVCYKSRSFLHLIPPPNLRTARELQQSSSYLQSRCAVQTFIGSSRLYVPTNIPCYHPNTL